MTPVDALKGEVVVTIAAGWRHTGKPAAVYRLCPHSMCEWHVFSKVSTHMMTALTSGAAACSLASATANTSWRG